MSWFLRDYLDDPLFFGRVFEPATLTAIAAIGTATAAGYSAVKSGKAPKLEPKTPMPDPFDDAERKRREEERRVARGRASTVLDESADISAADSYSNDLLGA